MAIFWRGSRKNIMCLERHGTLQGLFPQILLKLGKCPAHCGFGLPIVPWLRTETTHEPSNTQPHTATSWVGHHQPHSQQKSATSQHTTQHTATETCAEANVPQFLSLPTSVCQDTGNDTTTPGRSVKLCRRLCRPALKSPQITSNHLKSPHITHPADQPF